MSIAEIAVKRPLLIVVIFVVLFLFGSLCYTRLNYNLLPKMEIATVTVNTIYPGASASEVESSVTKKLEDAFASVEGLDNISSNSQEGVSVITIEFKSGTNVDEAERKVQRKADQTINDLPKDIDRPVVSKVNLEEMPVIRAGVTSNLPPKELYTLVDKRLLPTLQNVAGVGQVNIIGGNEREIQININQDKLKAYGISITQLTDAVANANTSFPAGKLETQNQQLSLQFDANLDSIAQMNDIIIMQKPGQGSVYLKDVAEVIDGTTKATAINHINGIASIGIQIIKQSDANAVNVSKGIKKAFADIEQQYKNDDLKFLVSSDQSTYTMKSADAVMEDLVMAVLIVGVVMLAFLHSFRSSMFVLVALPSSIIPTFIAMYLLGFSLNLMTLMAMSLVVGILVDDSIVVLENIYRHLEMGVDKKQAALDGRNEIGFTALAITLVDVVVFLPLALAGGLIGAILREFALVVVISTLMSLFVSFTVTPMLASRFGKLTILKKETIWGKINITLEDGIEKLKDVYAQFLDWTLTKKRWLLSAVIILLIGSIMLVANGFIGGSFMPTADQGELVVNLELAPEASIYNTNMATQDAEKIILQHPEVVKAFSNIGFVSGSVSGSSNNANLAEITVGLIDGEKRNFTSDEFGVILQKELADKLPGVKVTAASVGVTGTASAAPIQIAIKGLDLDSVRSVAEKYKSIIENLPGTQFVKLSVKAPKQEVGINLDREKMTLMGLNASVVGKSIQNAFSGNDKNKFKENGDEYKILIGLDANNKTDINDVKNLSFINNDGQHFVLSQFADVYLTLGESVLERTDRLHSIKVTSNVVGVATGTVANNIKESTKNIKLPQGISVDYKGDTKNQGDAFGSLGLALITGIILVYLVMVALYDNAIYPFVVLFSIPVALIGALLALALTMQTLNVFTIIGMIMLLGLVSKNAILIVDFANHLKEKGASVHEALVEAGKERLRPILMTTLAMIFGMLPIALAKGSGAEFKNGMAWVIIGGLTSSMILTLFVVPAMYMIIEKWMKGKKKVKVKEAIVL